MKYKLRETEIDAMQLKPSNTGVKELLKFIHNVSQLDEVLNSLITLKDAELNEGINVATTEGMKKCGWNDYVIRDKNGELSVHKKNDFQLKYYQQLDPYAISAQQTFDSDLYAELTRMETPIRNYIPTDNEIREQVRELERDIIHPRPDRIERDNVPREYGVVDDGYYPQAINNELRRVVTMPPPPWGMVNTDVRANLANQPRTVQHTNDTHTHNNARMFGTTTHTIIADEGNEEDEEEDNDGWD